MCGRGVLKSFFHLYIQFWGICPTHHRLVWVRIVQVYFLESHFLPLIMSHLQNNRLIFIWVKRLLLKKNICLILFSARKKNLSFWNSAMCMLFEIICVRLEIFPLCRFFLRLMQFLMNSNNRLNFFPDLRNCDPTSRRSRTTATGSKSSLPRPSEIPPHFSFCQ